MDQNFYYIGIDNGTTGSITILDKNCKIVYHDAIPTIKTINYTKSLKHITRIDFLKLIDILSPYKDNCRIITEYPAINPKFINTSILAARSFEALIIAFEVLKIGYEVISSKVWQKELLGNVPKKDLKFVADQRAKQLFQIDVKKGFGDSILMAYYLYKKMNGNQKND